MIVGSRKPLHVIRIKKSEITDEMFTKHLDDGYAVAQNKLDDFSVHMPYGAECSISSESDDNEIRFYLNIKVSF